MANMRKTLKSYLGFKIVLVNRYIYTGYNGHDYFEAYSLKELKRKIKNYIQ